MDKVKSAKAQSKYVLKNLKSMLTSDNAKCLKALFYLNFFIFFKNLKITFCAA